MWHLSMRLFVLEWPQRIAPRVTSRDSRRDFPSPFLAGTVLVGNCLFAGPILAAPANSTATGDQQAYAGLQFAFTAVLLETCPERMTGESRSPMPSGTAVASPSPKPAHRRSVSAALRGGKRADGESGSDAEGEFWAGGEPLRNPYGMKRMVIKNAVFLLILPLLV